MSLFKQLTQMGRLFSRNCQDPLRHVSSWNVSGIRMLHGHAHSMRNSRRTQMIVCECLLFLHTMMAHGEEFACQCKSCRRCRFDPWLRKIPWRRVWQPTPVFLPGKSHGQRSLAGYSPWDCRESRQLSVCVEQSGRRSGGGQLSS